MAGVKVERIYTLNDLAVCKNALIAICRKAFSEKPWHIFLTEQEVEELFTSIITSSKNIVLTIRKGNKIVGATFCTSMAFKPELYDYLKGINPDDVIYLAASFIDPVEQRKKYGSVLHGTRLALAKQEGWKYALQRTSEKTGMYRLIQRTGFREVGRQMVPIRMFIDGQIVDSEGERILSLKNL